MEQRKIQEALSQLLNEAIERIKPVPKYDKCSSSRGIVSKNACSNQLKLPTPVKYSTLPTQPVPLNATEVIEAINDGRVYFKGMQIKSIEHLKELAKQKTN